MLLACRGVVDSKEIRNRNSNNIWKTKIKWSGMREGEGNDESSAENSLIPFDELNMNPGNLIFLFLSSSCFYGLGLKWFQTPSSCMPSFDLYRSIVIGIWDGK